MHLIRTVLKGTQFAIELVKNQTNTAPDTIDVENNVLTADFKTLTKYPVGTVFVVPDIKWGDITSSVLGTPHPIAFGVNVYATPTLDEMNYFVEWAIRSGEYSNAELLQMGDMITTHGYLIDVASRINAYKADETGTLRERIMRMYPCPAEDEIGFHIEPDVWYLLIRNIMRGENTLLIGPTGLKNRLLFA